MTQERELPPEPFYSRRKALRDQLDLKFVERQEFCNLLVGYRNLVRCDDEAADVQGLLDVDSGTRFLIEREKLFPR